MLVSPRPPLETFLTVFRQRPSYINLTVVLHLLTPWPSTTNTRIKYIWDRDRIINRLTILGL